MIDQGIVANDKVVYIPSKRLDNIYQNCNALSRLRRVQDNAHYGIVVSVDGGELCYYVKWYNKKGEHLETEFAAIENIELYRTNEGRNKDV